MQTLRFIALAIVSLLTFTAVAEAACLTTDMNNTNWFAYIKFTGGWSRCTLSIGANGTVTGGTCSSYEDGGATASETITGGSLKITQACVVTGTIITSVSGQHRIVQAVLDRGKTVLIGVGKDINNNDAWQFSAVKR